MCSPVTARCRYPDIDANAPPVASPWVGIVLDTTCPPVLVAGVPVSRKQAMGTEDSDWHAYCDRCDKPCQSPTWPASLCRLCELGRNHALAEQMWKRDYPARGL